MRDKGLDVIGANITLASFNMLVIGLKTFFPSIGEGYQINLKTTIIFISIEIIVWCLGYLIARKINDKS